jgi:signal transduction histidine kinase
MVTRSRDASVPAPAAILEAGDRLHALAGELAAATQPEDVLAGVTRALAKLFPTAVCAAVVFDPIEARWVLQTSHAEGTLADSSSLPPGAATPATQTVGYQVGDMAAGPNRPEGASTPESARGWPHAFAGTVHRSLRRALPAPRRDGTSRVHLDDLALRSLAPSPEAILAVALRTITDGTGLLLMVWPAPPAAAVRASAQQHLTALAGLAELALLALTHRRRLEALQTDSLEHDAFISLLGHDLRTPLTAVRGYAQLLVRQARRQPASPMAGGLDVIIQQADQLGLLTELLLDVTRVRTGRLALDRRPLDLGTLLRQALASLAEDRRARVILDAPESGPIVDGDQRRLSQVLQALLGFAEARVALPGGRGSGLRCELTVEEEAAHLLLEDGGPPLDAQTQAMLFVRLPAPAGFSRRPVLPAIDLYQQAHLFVARGIIEAHHGRISLQSPIPEQEAGAQMHVWLPLATTH